MKENNNPLVSVCVPIYGVEKYIERCAISLFEQTYINIEYIFVNDCTEDKSIEVLKNVINRYPQRVAEVFIIEHTTNQGLGAARNTAVAKAKGKFIMHVDSDDWLDITAVEKCVRKYIETNADIVSFPLYRIMNKKNIVDRIPDFDNARDFIIALISHTITNNVCGRLIRRSLYTDNDIWVTDGVNMSEDLNVIPRLAYYAKIIVNIPEPLYFYYCQNTSSYTKKFKESDYFQLKQTINTLLEFFKDKDEEYKKAIKIRNCQGLLKYLIACSKENGHRKLYNEIRKELKQYTDYIQRNISISYKVALMIKDYRIFCLYVRIASQTKKMLSHFSF